MDSLIKSLKKRIAIAEKFQVVGTADYHSGYKRALEETLDDLSFAVANLKVDVHGDLQPIENWDGDVIVVAVSSLKRRLELENWKI